MRCSRPVALVLIGFILCLFGPGTPAGQAGGKMGKLPEAVEKALSGGGTFTLLSLQPTRDPNGFNGWKVLGKKTLEVKADRQRVIDALAKGAAEPGLAPARCFIPRHGVEVTSKGKTVGLVICFECYQVHVHTDGKRASDFLIGRSPQPVLNKILSDAGIPLAPK